MKRILTLVACIGFCINLNANGLPPTPNQDPSNEANQNNYQNTLTGKSAPVTPATLLLLSLGGTAVGIGIYKNNKKD